MIQNGLIELPLNANEKYKVLKSKFMGEDDSILQYLSKLTSIVYIVDKPVFTHYYIKDNQVLSKFISCITLHISGFESYYRYFALYSIVDGKYIRGAYVEYDGINKMRDYKIDEIIGSQ